MELLPWLGLMAESAARLVGILFPAAAAPSTPAAAPALSAQAAAGMPLYSVLLGPLLTLGALVLLVSALGRGARRGPLGVLGSMLGLVLKLVLSVLLVFRVLDFLSGPRRYR